MSKLSHGLLHGKFSETVVAVDRCRYQEIVPLDQMLLEKFSMAGKILSGRTVRYIHD
jgi:hypothetical protein